MTCGMRTNPVHGCFDNLEWLNYGYLPSQRGSYARELPNSLRLTTAVPGQDLSGVWITVHGREPTRVSASP
jgi:hypothetical protein